MVLDGPDVPKFALALGGLDIRGYLSHLVSKWVSTPRRPIKLTNAKEYLKISALHFSRERVGCESPRVPLNCVLLGKAILVGDKLGLV